MVLELRQRHQVRPRPAGEDVVDGGPGEVGLFGQGALVHPGDGYGKVPADGRRIASTYRRVRPQGTLGPRAGCEERPRGPSDPAALGHRRSIRSRSYRLRCADIRAQDTGAGPFAAGSTCPAVGLTARGPAALPSAPSTYPQCSVYTTISDVVSDLGEGEDGEPVPLGSPLRVVTDSSVWIIRADAYLRLPRSETPRPETASIGGRLADGRWHGHRGAWWVADGDRWRIRLLPVAGPPCGVGVITGPIVSCRAAFDGP